MGGYLMKNYWIPRRSMIAGMACLAAAVVVGCGGGGSTVSAANVYTGAWTGNWNSQTLSDGGTMSLTVRTDGSVTGTMNRVGGLAGNVAGTVNDNGDFNLQAGFTTNGNYTVTGNMVRNSGHLLGAMDILWLGQHYGGSFSLTPGSGGTTGG